MPQVEIEKAALMINRGMAPNKAAKLFHLGEMFYDFEAVKAIENSTYKDNMLMFFLLNTNPLKQEAWENIFNEIKGLGIDYGKVLSDLIKEYGKTKYESNLLGGISALATYQKGISVDVSPRTPEDFNFVSFLYSFDLVDEKAFKQKTVEFSSEPVMFVNCYLVEHIFKSFLYTEITKALSSMILTFKEMIENSLFPFTAEIKPPEPDEEATSVEVFNLLDKNGEVVGSSHMYELSGGKYKATSPIFQYQWDMFVCSVVRFANKYRMSDSMIDVCKQIYPDVSDSSKNIIQNNVNIF
jgi:hypothetical protein